MIMILRGTSRYHVICQLYLWQRSKVQHVLTHRTPPSRPQVKHLDVDAPALFRGLFEQDRSGLWDRKTVQCSSGDYWAGDYFLWRRWRNTVAKPI